MGLEDLTGGSKFIDDLVNTNPTAGDQKSEGDDHIRGVKNVLLNSFPNITGAMTTTHTVLNLFASVTALASSDDVIDNFPSGTLMLFQQTAAPTGWTKQVVHNDKGLRVVSGTASSGGTDAYSTCFSASKATESHVLTVAEIPAHTHLYYFSTTGGVGNNSSGSNSHTTNDSSDPTSSTGGDGGHTHDITLDLQYVDVIIASKD